MLLKNTRLQNKTLQCMRLQNRIMMNLIWAAVAVIKSSVTRVEYVVSSAELMELDVIV